MHTILKQLHDELVSFSKGLDEHIPNSSNFNTAHSNWSFPGICKIDLIEHVDSIAKSIQDENCEDIYDLDNYFMEMIASLEYMRKNTIPQIWGNSALAVPAIQETLRFVESALKNEIFKKDTDKETAKALRKLATQVRAMESRINSLTPRIDKISEMIEVIESASETADQLPTTLDDLREAKETIEGMLKDAEKDRTQILIKKGLSDEISSALETIKTEADQTLIKCQSAYRSATSQGLAAAFSERSSSLSWSMWVWVAGLITALVLGGIFGSIQINKLSSSLETNTTTVTIAVNFLLSLLSVGAPIWFAWISTKQINQRFRLAEDYAFKASISRAYEGYRGEAARLDKDLEISLLTSALNRLDEIPLRLVEPTSHGSPMHELLTMDILKKAIATVPNFMTDMIKFADTSLHNLAHGKPAKEKHDTPTSDKDSPAS